MDIYGFFNEDESKQFWTVATTRIRHCVADLPDAELQRVAERALAIACSPHGRTDVRTGRIATMAEYYLTCACREISMRKIGHGGERW